MVLRLPDAPRTGYSSTSCTSCGTLCVVSATPSGVSWDVCFIYCSALMLKDSSIEAATRTNNKIMATYLFNFVFLPFPYILFPLLYFFSNYNIFCKFLSFFYWQFLQNLLYILEKASIQISLIYAFLMFPAGIEPATDP